MQLSFPAAPREFSPYGRRAELAQARADIDGKQDHRHQHPDGKPELSAPERRRRDHDRKSQDAEGDAASTRTRPLPVGVADREVEIDRSQHSGPAAPPRVAATAKPHRNPAPGDVAASPA